VGFWEKHYGRCDCVALFAFRSPNHNSYGVTDRNSPIDASALQSLRHTLATLAYRAGKAVRGAPTGFSDVRAGESTRTAGETLAHMGDLMEWAGTYERADWVWREQPAGSWADDVGRFFSGLAALDGTLAKSPPTTATAEKLFQGPIADALTHTGQITVLRRIAGSPVRGENYSMADIRGGSVGQEQPTPRREFD
jgi:hypothetical protein